MSALLADVLRREFAIALRRRADLLVPLGFYLVVAGLFPLGIRPDEATLRAIGPAVLWIAAMLATLLGLDRLFAHDHADGSLEQFLLLPQPLALVVLAKVAAHWILCGLPLTLLSPLLAVQYGLTAPQCQVLSAALLLGTPVLGMLGALGAALTLAARANSVLIALIILPLYIPILILGTGAVAPAAAGDAGHLMLLGAMLLGAVALAPAAVAATLRIALE